MYPHDNRVSDPRHYDNSGTRVHSIHPAVHGQRICATGAYRPRARRNCRSHDFHAVALVGGALIFYARQIVNLKHAPPAHVTTGPEFDAILARGSTASALGDAAGPRGVPRMLIWRRLNEPSSSDPQSRNPCFRSPMPNPAMQATSRFRNLSAFR
ncbi:hypothetical protein PSPO01_05026 [Paraphaeosphaeria sporulosa]